MDNGYIINEWALVRRNEMVDIPDGFDIHPDFLNGHEKPEFEKAFRQIWKMFYQIYEDISDSPEKFTMPLYKASEYRYGSEGWPEYLKCRV